MATLSLTVELAGFQHGDGVFHIKALAFACPRTRSSGSRVFDSTRIVPDSAAALRTFAYQTAHHGFPLHSTGLPPTSTGVVLQTFLQVTMLDWMEAGNAAPATLILWTKGLRRPRAPNPFSRAPHPHKELEGPALPSTYAALSGNPTLVNLPESCTTCPLARWARSRLTASLYGHNLASRNVFYIDFRPCISVFAIVTFVTSLKNPINRLKT